MDIKANHWNLKGRLNNRRLYQFQIINPEPNEPKAKRSCF